MTAVWLTGGNLPPVPPAGFVPDTAVMLGSVGTWTRVADGLAAFKLYPHFAEHAPQAQVQQVIDWSNQAGIPLALEVGVLQPGPGGAGQGVEGYDIGAVDGVQRLKSLGADLRYVAMDEPYYYGHQYAGANAAQAPVADLARQVAATVGRMRAIYPDLQVGDIEPVFPGQDYGAWVGAYQAAAGQPLAFLDADVLWWTNYAPALRQLAATLHANGVAYGVIVNGAADATSGAAWEAAAVAHFTQVESDPTLAPDRAVFQTWNPYPLPSASEDAPGTLLNTALRYLEYKGIGTTPTTSAAGTSLPDPTGLAGELARLYQAAFRRAPDLPGLQFWMQRAGDGVPLGAVAAGFAASPEFIAGGAPDDAGYVARLYQNVLGRAPDDAGLRDWTGRLAGGAPRGDVLLGFADSAENIRNTLGVAGDTQEAEAYRLYRAAFARTPDTAGLDDWTTRLHNGTTPLQAAQGFVASPEFQAAYAGLDATGFLARLYGNVLGRAPDAAGLDFWERQLASGTSQAGVLLGFSDSAENRAATAAATHDGWVFLPNA